MSRQAFSEAKRWSGKEGLERFRLAGAPPAVAAYGAFVLGQIANVDASCNLKGWNFESNFIDRFVSDITACKTLDDIESTLARNLNDLSKDTAEDMERVSGSKNIRQFAIKHEEVFVLAKNVGSWPLAHVFLQRYSSEKPAPHDQSCSAGEKARYLCEKFGLSSLMIPGHVNDPMDLLVKLEKILLHVTNRMQLDSPAALGAFGRLSISFSLPPNEIGLRGVCTTFDALKEGFVNLPNDMDEKTIHHELLHWQDVCAKWSMGIEKTASDVSDCISAVSNTALDNSHPARRIRNLIADFAENNPEYIRQYHELDFYRPENAGKKPNEMRHYWISPHEILARSFEYGVDKKLYRSLDILASEYHQNLGDDMNSLSTQFLDIIRAPVFNWASSNQQSWSKRIDWDPHGLEHESENNDTQDLLLRSFSSLPSIAKSGLSKFKSAIGMRL